MLKAHFTPDEDGEACVEGSTVINRMLRYYDR